MNAAIRAALAFVVLLVCPQHAGAAVDAPVGTTAYNAPSAMPATLDSPAQLALRKLRKPVAQPQSMRIPQAKIAHPDLVTRLEEIRVYGRNEPEDYVGPRLSPMLQFRARLERDVPLSPARKVQHALCSIGLCGIYGPEGIPLGDSPEARAESRLTLSTTQLNAQFRGALQ